jgi:hypothetical protein
MLLLNTSGGEQIGYLNGKSCVYLVWTDEGDRYVGPVNIWKYTHKQDKLVYNEWQKPVWIQVRQVHIAEIQISSIPSLICSFRPIHSGTKHFKC